MAMEAPVHADLARYGQFAVEPVEIRLDERSNATDIKAQMLASKLQADIQQAVTLPSSIGSKVATVRIALTRVRRSAPLLNIHPGTKLTGAGLGEAGIEAEIVDATTGQQLWALVEVRKGDRMELDTFAEYDDAEDAIAYFAQRFHDLVNRPDQSLESATR